MSNVDLGHLLLAAFVFVLVRTCWRYPRMALAFVLGLIVGRRG